jgi:hypothetical protein
VDLLNVSESFLTQKKLHDMEFAQDVIEQGLEEYSRIRGMDGFDMDKFDSGQGFDQCADLRGMDKFESEFALRTNDANMDEFSH